MHKLNRYMRTPHCNNKQQMLCWYTYVSLFSCHTYQNKHTWNQLTIHFIVFVLGKGPSGRSNMFEPGIFLACFPSEDLSINVLLYVVFLHI